MIWLYMRRKEENAVLKLAPGIITEWELLSRELCVWVAAGAVRHCSMH